MGQTSCAVFALIQFTEQTNFEIKNHSNHPNRQVLLSLFSSAIMSLVRTTIFFQCYYVAGNFQSALNEGRVLSPSSHMANSGIVVMHITTTMAKLSVDQGHGSQLATVSSIVLKDGK